MRKPTRGREKPGGTVALFRTKAERSKAARIKDLRQGILAFAAELSPGAVAEIVSALDTASERATEGWRFMLMDPSAMRRVGAMLEEGSRRPAVARRVLDAALERLSSTSQEILATQADLAREIKESPANVSHAIADLVRLSVIWREPGEGRAVRLFLNPWLATRLGIVERQAAQAAAPRIGTAPTPAPPPPARQARPALRIVGGD